MTKKGFQTHAFYNLEDTLAKNDRRFNDPLVGIDSMVPWECFREDLDAALRRARGPLKSRAGRKSWDPVLMFKILILGSMFNSSDQQLEKDLCDKLTFKRFADLDVSDEVPDCKTIWVFRELLTRVGAIDSLFGRFDKLLRDRGFMVNVGQVVDASMVAVPIQRNTREENEQIKQGKVPEEWKENPAKLAQKDTSARWSKKNNKYVFGYKNHININPANKLIRKWVVTPANKHDGQELEGLLVVGDQRQSQKGADGAVYADKAYRSEANEAMVENNNMTSHIHYKANRGTPLTPRQRTLNRKRTKVRARVEHVFAAQKNDLGGTLVRCIGIDRATMRIGLKNLAYNMKRLTYLNEHGTLSPT